VVIEVMIIPIPKPNRPVNIISKGNVMIYELGSIAYSLLTR
jgi:hypothetical protein